MGRLVAEASAIGQYRALEEIAQSSLSGDTHLKNDIQIDSGQNVNGILLRRVWLPSIFINFVQSLMKGPLGLLSRLLLYPGYTAPSRHIYKNCRLLLIRFT